MNWLSLRKPPIRGPLRLCYGDVRSPAVERHWLRALLGALEVPVRAANLPGDDPTMTAVARHHRLTPLLSVLCNDTLPRQLGDSCRHDRIVTTARNMILGGVAQECIRGFASAGVPAIVLKGLDYETRLYGTPGARPTSDVDLLVPQQDRRAAFQALDRLGFEPRACAPGFDEPDYHEVAWTRAGIEVDLHMALTPLVRCRIDYPSLWSAAVPARFGETPALVLSRPHAAVFQALHMSIDHFVVPAIYLFDLVRLLADPATRSAAETTARRWECLRPFETAVALAENFLPRSIPAGRTSRLSHRARHVIDAYGPIAPLPRAEQLFRKFSHFDTLRAALHYFEVQSRRNIREHFVRGKSARARLSL